MNIQNYIITKLSRYPKIKVSLKNTIKITNSVLNYSKIKFNEGALNNEIILEYNKNREFGIQQYLCHAPFTSLYFKSNGDVVACCKNTVDVYGNVKDDKIETIWHSIVKKKLQENIKNGKFDGGCSFCNEQLKSKNFSGVHARIHDQPFFTKKNTFPTEITFEISNTCNLECIMCSGEYSSSIRKNREQLPSIIDRYPSDFFEQIKPFLDAVKIIRLQGGEPFLIDDYLKIIDYLNKLNKNCKIYIQTNGTILNKRVEKILANNQIHLSVSMDSLNQENLESIRKNLDYMRFRKNLEKLTSICKQTNSVLNINFCLMRNNWKEIPSLFEFCFDNNYSLNIIPIDFPIIYSLEHLTIDELNYIENYIIEHTKTRDINHFKLIFNSLINSINEIKNKSMIREKQIENLLANEIENLKLELFNGLKNKDLYEYNIKKIKDHIYEKLEPFDSKSHKLILAKTILNNNVLENVNLKVDFIEDKITQRILEYIDHEISLLN